MCPICNDIVLGLDKLTIHLFGHTLLPTRPEPLPQPAIESVTMTKVEAVPSVVSQPLFLKIEGDTSSPVPNADDLNRSQLGTGAGAAPPADPKFIESLKVVRRRRPKNSNQPAANQPGDQTVAPGIQLIGEPVEQQQHPQQAQCYICGYTFRTKELQRMHLRLVHEIVTIDTVSAGDDNMNGAGTGSAGPAVNFNRFHCEYCAKYFKMKGSLRLHLRVVHGVYGVAAKAVMNQKSMDAGGQPTTPSAGGERMNQYETVDHGPCDDSDGTSAIGAGLGNSLICLESGENPASSDAKQWECDTCAKSFTTKYFLKKHKRLHTGMSISIGPHHRQKLNRQKKKGRKTKNSNKQEKWKP